MLPISVKYLCRNTKCRADFSRYLKRFMMDSRFLPSSQTSGRMYNTVVSNKLMMWKSCRSPHFAVICKQLLNANDRNRVRWVVLELQQDGACTDFFENLSEINFKGDLSNATTFNPPLFSLVDTFKTHRFRLCFSIVQSVACAYNSLSCDLSTK